MTRLGRYQDPIDRLVQRGRKTVLIEGDFAIFHIGARPTHVCKWDQVLLVGWLLGTCKWDQALRVSGLLRHV